MKKETLNNKLRRIDSNSIKLLFLAAAIFLVMALLRDKFVSEANIYAMAFQLPELGLFALAMTFVIISGGIDLSVVSIANVSGILVALIMRGAIERNASNGEVLLLTGLSFGIAIVVGFVLGGLNGLLIAYAGIPPILVTLGTSNLFTGIGMIFTKGNPISGFPDLYLQLGSGKALGIPISLIMFAIVAIICVVILNKTKYGMQLKFFGSNSKASLFSGIPNKSIGLRTYIISGIISALAGLEIIARTNSAKANYGSSYVVNSILCVILGGVASEGGHGTIGGVLLALLSLQFLSSGFNMLRITGTAKEMAWGILLLAVTAVNFFVEQRKLKRGLKVKKENKAVKGTKE